MKYTKKKNYTGTIRTVHSDDRSETLGVIGTVKDMMCANIFAQCDAPGNFWCFLDISGKGRFFRTKSALMQMLEELYATA